MKSSSVKRPVKVLGVNNPSIPNKLYFIMPNGNVTDEGLVVVALQRSIAIITNPV